MKPKCPEVARHGSPVRFFSCVLIAVALTACDSSGVAVESPVASTEQQLTLINGEESSTTDASGVVVTDSDDHGDANGDNSGSNVADIDSNVTESGDEPDAETDAEPDTETGSDGSTETGTETDTESDTDGNNTDEGVDSNTDGSDTETETEQTEEQRNLVPVPETGAYIGMNTGDAANGVTVSSRQSLLGHDMAIERIFYSNQQWNIDRINVDQVVSAYVQGRIPMVSYKVGVWKSVTNGNSDAIIDKLAGQIKESGVPMLLTFHHEPEDNGCFNDTPDCGLGQTAQDYVAMWRYIHDRFNALNVDNVSWNWVVMGWQWGPWGNDRVRNHIESMFPGVDYVDWMSADLYNMAGNCSLTPQQVSNRWSELEVAGQGWYDWASQFSKPLALAEWGTFDDTLIDGRKALWYRNASATLQNWTNIKAAVYFDRNHDGCDWRIDTGGDIELDGYRDLIDDPYFIKG